MSLAEPPPPAPKGIARLFKKIAFEARSLPYMLGIKEPCASFTSIPPKDQR